MAYDDARDLYDPGEVRLTHNEVLARNNLWSERQALRVIKGRPAHRIATAQYDRSQGRVLAPTVAPDPMLDLYAARHACRSSAYSAQRYGQIRQAVVSPLSGWLP